MGRVAMGDEGVLAWASLVVNVTRTEVFMPFKDVRSAAKVDRLSG